MRINRVAIVLAGFVASGVALHGAHATNTTASMNNSATVTAYCTVSTTGLSFGTYNGSAAVSTTATISALCTNSTSYTVALNAGTTTGATVSARSLANGSNKLNYSISQDSGHTTNWGNTPGTDTPAASTGNGSTQTLTAYGNIAASQFVTPGSYTDTVTVTLTY